MKNVSMLTRASAIFSLVLISSLSSLQSVKAESAAEFFAKDRTGWSQSSRASGPSQVSRARAGRSSIRPSSARVRGSVALRGSHAVFAAAARRQGVPVRLALATIAVESRGNCRAVGRAGELGPLQIKLGTARGLGYRGSASGLRNCGAGLYWGMRHLAISYRKCGSAVLHQKGLGGSCGRSSYAAKVQRMASRI